MLRAAQSKAKNPHYGPHTALIITVDDFLAISDPKDVAALDELARHQIVPLLAQGSPFVLLALEGGRALHRVYRLR